MLIEHCFDLAPVHEHGVLIVLVVYIACL